MKIEFNINDYLNNKELINDVKLGVNAVTLANKYDLHYNIVKRLKTEFKYNNEFKKQFLNYYDENLSFYEIAENMNVSKDKIYSFAKELKLPTKDRNIKPERILEKQNIKNRDEEILRMLENNLTTKKICEILNVDKNVVNWCKKKNNINKQKENRENKLKLVGRIINDIVNNNIFYNDLIEKYNLNYAKIQLLQQDYGLISISEFYKKKRNDEFKRLYKEGKGAKEILDCEINKKSGKFKIRAINRLYDIVHEETYKQTKINEPFALNPEVKATIKTLLELGKTFKFIYKYLNEKDYKTIVGKDFTISNINYTIKKIKEEDAK